jgi:hypothetical protein
MCIAKFDDFAEIVDARRRIVEFDLGLRGQRTTQPAPSFTSPLAIGLLLTVMPPMAVALVWSSPHFAHAARVAVTVYGMFTFMTALAAIILVLHS